MSTTTPTEVGRSRLAEAAARNVRVDCALAEAPEERMDSRMLQLCRDGLLLAVPSREGRPVELAPGQGLIGLFRLGPELLRFVTRVKSLTQWQPQPDMAVPALRLVPPETLEVVQRRRFYRVPLMACEPLEATIWPVEMDSANRPRIACQYTALLADVSAGGIGLIVTDESFLEAIAGRQIWVRFRLPGQSESLIFRMVYRHRRVLEDGRQMIGLEYGSFIEPAAHHNVIEKLTHFVAQQQRESLNRRKDR